MEIRHSHLPPFDDISAEEGESGSDEADDFEQSFLLYRFEVLPLLHRCHPTLEDLLEHGNS